MLDVKYRFTCGDSDLSEIIKKSRNNMTMIVATNFYLFRNILKQIPPACTSSKLTIETLEQGVKYVQS